MDVVRIGFDPDQDHLLAPFGGRLSAVGVKDGGPGGSTGRGRETGREDSDLGVGVNGPVEQVVDLLRLHPLERLLLGDDPLGEHVHGDLHRSGGGALGAPRLEHVQLAPLDGELHVLNVAVVSLQLGRNLRKLPVNLGQRLAQGLDRLGGANSRHHVLALGLEQVLAEEPLLPGGGITGEGDPGAGVVTHVAEDHGLDVHRRAQGVGDVVVLPVGHRPAPVPRRENGGDGQRQLLPGVLWEGRFGVRPVDLPVLLREHGESLGRKLGVAADFGGPLGRLQLPLEELAVHPLYDPPEELDEAAIGVEGEATVAGLLGQPLQGLLVKAQVEDGVHHPGHGQSRARPHRHQQRLGWVAEPLPGLGLQLLQVLFDLVQEAGGELVASLHVGIAGLGRNREARRHRHPCLGHLGDARSLAPEQRPHFGTPLFEVVDELRVSLPCRGWTGTHYGPCH